MAGALRCDSHNHDVFRSRHSPEIVSRRHLVGGFVFGDIIEDLFRLLWAKLYLSRLIKYKGIS